MPFGWFLTHVWRVTGRIWNFHVWNECYCTRADLPEKSKDGALLNLGGWQAVDATPQEASDGYYQCGPASIAGIRLGLTHSYDADFLIGEVNADVRRYVKLTSGGAFGLTSEKWLLSSVNTKDVGRKMLTKALGSWGTEDLVDRYKAMEGTVLERASLLRASSEAAAARSEPRGSLTISINDGSAIRLGSSAACTLKLTDVPATEVFPEEGVRLAIVAFASQYTGHGRHVVGKANAVLSADKAQAEGITLTLDTNDKDFDTMMRDTGFPLTFVGTALWKDQKEGVLDTMGHAEINPLVSLVTEETTELLQEEGTIIKQESVEPAPKIGSSSTVTIKVINPFPHKAMTNCVLFTEGRKLAERASVELGTIEAGGEATTQVEILPRARAQPLALPQQNEYMLGLTLECDEVQGISSMMVFAPAPLDEEGEPPAGEPEPAPEPLALAYKAGYLTAGNNVHVGTYSSFEEAKLKCSQLAKKAAEEAAATGGSKPLVGFTFRHADAAPAAGERMTVYFKSSTRFGAHGAWHTYLLG